MRARKLGRQLGLPTRAADLHAAPRQSRLVLVRGLAVCRSERPGGDRGVDGTGDRGSISLYVVERGAMRELYCNDSFIDSLGAFYSVISSTQGGWTWLSSEGRYMGAAAWGDMRPRQQSVLRAAATGAAFRRRRRSRSTAPWRTGIATPSITLQGADRHPRRAAKRSRHVESRRRAAGRGHPAPARHPGPARQGGRNATGVRGRDDPRRRSSVAHNRRQPAGAHRRRGAERGRQHAAARSISTRLVRAPSSARARLHLWVPPMPGDPGVTIGAAWLLAHLAGARAARR